MGDFVRTFLTLYLTRILGLPTALSGTFVMLSAMASSVGAFAAGHFVDSHGRRRIILTSQLASALLIGSCGFLPTGTYIPWLLIAGTFFMGAIRPAVNAVVADITEPDRRQSAYGLLYLGTNIGVAVGPMIAGFLFRHYIRWIFIGDAVSTLIAMAVVFPLYRKQYHMLDMPPQAIHRIWRILNGRNVVPFCLFCSGARNSWFLPCSVCVSTSSILSTLLLYPYISILCLAVQGLLNSACL